MLLNKKGSMIMRLYNFSISYFLDVGKVYLEKMLGFFSKRFLIGRKYMMYRKFLCVKYVQKSNKFLSLCETMYKIFQFKKNIYFNSFFKDFTILMEAFESNLCFFFRKRLLFSKKK